jgi:hypothetical protein
MKSESHTGFSRFSISLSRYTFPFTSLCPESKAVSLAPFPTRRWEPSPNSSFHLLSEASVPRDSDVDGAFWVKALAKWCGRNIRCEGEDSVFV